MHPAPLQSSGAPDLCFLTGNLGLPEVMCRKQTPSPHPRGRLRVSGVLLGGWGPQQGSDSCAQDTGANSARPLTGMPQARSRETCLEALASDKRKCSTEPAGPSARKNNPFLATLGSLQPLPAFSQPNKYEVNLAPQLRPAPQLPKRASKPIPVQERQTQGKDLQLSFLLLQSSS